MTSSARMAMGPKKLTRSEYKHLKLKLADRGGRTLSEIEETIYGPRKWSMLEVDTQALLYGREVTEHPPPG
jgi:hypothetical protein